MVRQWGLFFEELPKTRKEASFFSEKNSSEEASSKGWMGFFLVNFLAKGWRSWKRSLRASWVTWEQLVPRRKRTVLGFSTAWGARFARARLERALRGLLEFLLSEESNYQDAVWREKRELTFAAASLQEINVVMAKDVYFERVWLLLSCCWSMAENATATATKFLAGVQGIFLSITITIKMAWTPAPRNVPTLDSGSQNSLVLLGGVTGLCGSGGFEVYCERRSTSPTPASLRRVVWRAWMITPSGYRGTRKAPSKSSASQLCIWSVARTCQGSWALHVPGEQRITIRLVIIQ